MQSNYTQFIIAANHTRKQKIAYQDSTTDLTFGELETGIQAQAWTLLTQGLVAGDRVVIQLPNSVYYPILFLACIQVGIIPVLIDFESPATIVQQLVEKSQAKLVINSPLKGERTDLAPVHAHHTQSLAFMICSSGTTGAPKLIEHQHGLFFNSIESTSGLYQVDETSILMGTQKMSFGWALGNYIMFSLYHGCCAVLFDQALTAAALINIIESKKVTHFFSNPTVYSLLARKNTIAKFSTLTHPICASEPLLPVLARQFWARYGIKLLNSYGSSETVINPIKCEISDDQCTAIGKLLPQWQVKVLDEHYNECTLGTPGVLYIETSRMAQRYHNQDDSAFSNNWFCTNDVVYVDAAGYYHFVNRQGQWVKINALWTSASEIENLLLSTGKIIESTVVFVDNDYGLKEAIAYVVPEVGQTIIPHQLRSELLELAKSHQVPKKIILVDQLPRTSRNKRVIDPVVLENYAS